MKIKRPEWMPPAKDWTVYQDPDGSTVKNSIISVPIEGNPEAFEIDFNYWAASPEDYARENQAREYILAAIRAYEAQP